MKKRHSVSADWRDSESAALAASRHCSAPSNRFQADRGCECLFYVGYLLFRWAFLLVLFRIKEMEGYFISVTADQYYYPDHQQYAYSCDAEICDK